MWEAILPALFHFVLLSSLSASFLLPLSPSIQAASFSLPHSGLPLLSALCKTAMPSPPFITSCSFTSLLPFPIQLSFLSARLGCPLLLPLRSPPFVPLHSLLHDHPKHSSLQCAPWGCSPTGWPHWMGWLIPVETWWDSLGWIGLSS